MICEYIWASMGVSVFVDKFTILKCNIVLPLNVVQLDSFNDDYGTRGQPSYIVTKLKLTVLES